MTTILKPGDLVVVDPTYATSRHAGRVFRVVRYLKVNVEVEPLDGGRPLRGAPALFVPYEGDVSVTAATTAGTGTPFLDFLWPGQVVTVTGPGWERPADERYVVLVQRDATRVSLARLGGDEGRTYPRVPRSYLTVVDVSC